MRSAIISPRCTPCTACRQGVTEWAVLISFFQLCNHSNHLQKWCSEKAVDRVSAGFHYRALSSVGNQAEVTCLCLG